MFENFKNVVKAFYMTGTKTYFGTTLFHDLFSSFVGFGRRSVADNLSYSFLIKKTFLKFCKNEILRFLFNITISNYKLPKAHANFQRKKPKARR